MSTFAREASLLREMSRHKCIVASPTIQVLNFSEASVQAFYKSLPHSKQLLVQELFAIAPRLEVYIYPLYGVTMATKIRVSY